MKAHPHMIGESYDDMWEWLMDNLPFKKKHLTENIVNLFKSNITKFSRLEDE
jgi:hypothetical protein